MKNLALLEKYLNQEWKSFTGDAEAHAVARKVETGMDENLKAALSRSRCFSDRLKNRPKMAPGRELEWAEARRAELALEERVPGALASSVSHCRGESESLVVAVACGGGKGVGVDIEFQNRAIKPELVQRFFHREELSLARELLPVHFWVLKEAAFKAVPRDRQGVVVQYRLSKWNENSRQGTMTAENLSCPVKLLSFDDVVLGLSCFRP